jgi:hypothetical protein
VKQIAGRALRRLILTWSDVAWRPRWGDGWFSLGSVEYASWYEECPVDVSPEKKSLGCLMECFKLKKRRNGLT